MPQVSEGIHLQEALDVEMEEVDSAQEDEHTVADFFAAPAPSLLASQQLVSNSTATTAVASPSTTPGLLAGEQGVPISANSTAAASPSPTPAPAPRRRPRRGFDMSTERRSARLSNAPRIPAMQKAQQNLCRKLGILNNDMLPFEAALQEFIAMFNGPLPQDIIAALTAILHIEDGDDTLDQALAGLVGEGVAELQADVQELQVEAGAAQVDEILPVAI
ncbi:hypothetical protein PVAP13_8NG085801 [Panicum virgatum]|uniref:Uncharacterized protein n=1 Tax=Panicum virgatum TaxID=38727 RepID=A0A8T0P768_PANVG|nr:hypothetical protein PVAP13_8NG085801 [Panicum virgatum]